MIIRLRDLQRMRKKYAEQKIIFVRGSFDLIHAGHIDYLKRARKRGDILVVALARDKDLLARKGKGRPILPLNQRMQVINAIRYVHYVLPLPTSATHTQNKLATLKVLKSLRPDFFVTPYIAWKSSLKKLEADYGTRLLIMKENRINSTTAMIEKAAKGYAETHS